MWSEAIRGDVAAGSRQPLDHHDQRLLCLQPHQRVIELFGAGGGAARRIDVNDDGAACEFSSRSAPRRAPDHCGINPSILTRAIEPEVVKAPRPPGDTATPRTRRSKRSRTPQPARARTSSLRRILRRSTIRSESSDIEIPPKIGRRVWHCSVTNGLTCIHQLRPNMKKTRPGLRQWPPTVVAPR